MIRFDIVYGVSYVVLVFEYFLIVKVIILE